MSTEPTPADPAAAIPVADADRGLGFAESVVTYKDGREETYNVDAPAVVFEAMTMKLDDLDKAHGDGISAFVMLWLAADKPSPNGQPTDDAAVVATVLAWLKTIQTIRKVQAGPPTNRAGRRQRQK